MHKTLKDVELLKYFKINKIALEQFYLF